jgi:hypothetical protein
MIFFVLSLIKKKTILLKLVPTKASKINDIFTLSLSPNTQKMIYKNKSLSELIFFTFSFSFADFFKRISSQQ